MCDRQTSLRSTGIIKRTLALARVRMRGWECTRTHTHSSIQIHIYTCIMMTQYRRSVGVRSRSDRFENALLTPATLALWLRALIAGWTNFARAPHYHYHRSARKRRMTWRPYEKRQVHTAGPDGLRKKIAKHTLAFVSNKYIYQSCSRNVRDILLRWKRWSQDTLKE